MDDNVERSVENTRQWLRSASSGDNECKNHLPRIGDDYQAQIPNRKTKYNYEDSAVDILQSESNLKSQMNVDDEALQLRRAHVGACAEEEGRRLSTLRSVADGAGIDDNSISSQKKDTRLDHRDNGCSSVCSSIHIKWKDIECKSFLLGLYTFGKNFCLVKRFVETREMSDVLSYYYGQFYRSNGYVRWSRSRKMKSARCIRKDKIYKGRRQNVLLSRMFLHVSYRCRKSLTEAARRFREGKLTLEDYVFRLKNMAGIDLLLEAVAVGQEKEDLTGTTLDHAERNLILFARPKVHSGPKWFALTKDEIIKCIRGVCRLSKKELEDLFWKAVWHHLVARGWRSEQPRDYSHVGSENPFVFLVPGVPKSRRRFVKGRDYFDSISEVLNKVASDPGQLGPEEIEVEENKENCTSYRDPLSNQQQLDNQDLLKLTLVDTSSICGELVKGRNLESLPVDTVLSSHSALSSEIERGTTDVSEKEAGVNNNSKLERASGVLADLTNCVINTAFHYDPVLLDPLIAQNTEEGTKEIALIDLNHPPLLLEAGNAGPVLRSLSETSDHLEMLNSSDNITRKEEPAIGTRRRSRRNCELTTKAFEDIALDLLGPKKKRKGVNSMSRSTSSLQVRGKTVGRSNIDAAGEDLATNQDHYTNMDE